MPHPDRNKIINKHFVSCGFKVATNTSNGVIINNIKFLNFIYSLSLYYNILSIAIAFLSL